MKSARRNYLIKIGDLVMLFAPDNCFKIGFVASIMPTLE